MNGLERGRQLPFPPRDSRERNVRPAVVQAGLADFGGELGVLLQRPLPVQRKQLLKTGGVRAAGLGKFFAIALEAGGLPKTTDGANQAGEKSGNPTRVNQIHGHRLTKGNFGTRAMDFDPKNSDERSPQYCCHGTNSVYNLPSRWVQYLPRPNR